MIIKTLKAISLGIKGGYKITEWALREDIEAVKKAMDKTPVIKDYDVRNPFVKKTTQVVNNND
jgi:transposase|tara:strand:- start:1013 stop:1201 length:189 start_codon:yes stop_codon:yes gene_type:complete